MKLISRFAVLLVLLGGLFLAASGINNTTQAANLCCTHCEGWYLKCMALCDEKDKACIQICEDDWHYTCYQYCDLGC